MAGYSGRRSPTSTRRRSSSDSSRSDAGQSREKPASVSPLLQQQSLHLSSALLERQKNNHNFFQTRLPLAFAHDDCGKGTQVHRRSAELHGGPPGSAPTHFLSVKNKFAAVGRSSRLLACRLNHCELAKLPRVSAGSQCAEAPRECACAGPLPAEPERVTNRKVIKKDNCSFY